MTRVIIGELHPQNVRADKGPRATRKDLELRSPLRRSPSLSRLSSSPRGPSHSRQRSKKIKVEGRYSYTREVSSLRLVRKSETKAAGKSLPKKWIRMPICYPKTRRSDNRRVRKCQQELSFGAASCVDFAMGDRRPPALLSRRLGPANQ